VSLFHQKRVQILLPLPLGGVLDYVLEEGLAQDGAVLEGDFVTVPLSGRHLQGVIWDLNPSDEGYPIEKLKPVLSKLELPNLPQTLRDFVDWVASYCLADRGSVLKMALSVPKAFDSEKKITLYKLKADLPDKLTKARKMVADLGFETCAMTVKDWAEVAAVSDNVIRGMVGADMMEAIEISGELPFAFPNIGQAGYALSEEQQKAADHMSVLVEEQKFKAVLLEGITGSGKTEVYFEAIAAALQKPQAQVLVLVPEISLTAQWLERFKGRFGVEPINWHSELTPAQRRRAWWSVITGGGRVVVGARSALFLPFTDLDLIIVDEEHSATFKQEEGVMYNGRDMAVVRAHQSGCPVVLASATPSLETLINADSGKYDWLYMGSRHGPAVLPDMHVIDMRKHKLKSGTWLASPLKNAIERTLENNEQTLLYLNRRGYAPLTLCRTCGHRMECGQCSAWLVEHKKYDKLECHHCGFNMKKPEVCPSCDNKDSMVACGPGIERVAEEIRELFPKARIAVMASDEISSPAAMKKIIESIENHEVDIIVGTQIVTKGYHFPLLTLVGVVDSDLGLEGGDPRTAERTWQQLEQVAGRAGRAEHRGRVVFQSYMPDHPVLKALISGDRDAFLEQEANSRENQKMPPFGKLAAVIISGRDKNAVITASRQMARSAPRGDEFTILGPVPAPMSYLRGKHRYRLLVKADKNVNIQRLMRFWLEKNGRPKAVRIQIDIDPYSFM
jgi:primosomal protein N' (replication factor Y)